MKLMLQFKLWKEYMFMIKRRKFFLAAKEIADSVFIKYNFKTNSIIACSKINDYLTSF